MSMDITELMREVKARPGFAEHVGMMMMHNGVVRAWSRADHAPVVAMKVTPDRERMAAICREMEQRPGIFAAVARAAEGILHPGEDVLLFVVAGDLRENVKAAYAEMLDRLKAESCVKQEFFE